VVKAAVLTWRCVSKSHGLRRVSSSGTRSMFTRDMVDGRHSTLIRVEAKVSMHARRQSAPSPLPSVRTVAFKFQHRTHRTAGRQRRKNQKANASQNFIAPTCQLVYAPELTIDSGAAAERIPFWMHELQLAKEAEGRAPEPTESQMSWEFSMSLGARALRHSAGRWTPAHGSLKERILGTCFYCHAKVRQSPTGPRQRKRTEIS
jgi:hypothetical protein